MSRSRARLVLAVLLLAGPASLAAAPPAARAKDAKELEGYPAGADVRVLTHDGKAVGPLDKLRVPRKYTVFDLYADWCAPCKLVDARLKQVLAKRKDVAVRKLNVVDFDSPLALEMGPKFDSLPWLVVFSPSGRRQDVVGMDFAELDDALKQP
jgi:thiol-disulfide isomerase/thioredoxin